LRRQEVGVTEAGPGWRSPGFFPIFGRGVLYGVAGGAVIGGAYGGAALVLYTWIAVIGNGLEGLVTLVFVVWAVPIGIIAGLGCGFGSGLLIGVILGAWLMTPNLRRAPVRVVAGWARFIAGGITGLLVAVGMRSSAGYDPADFVILILVPAVIAVTYGAWAGGRIVTTSAIRDRAATEGRLPA
jgi:hypothetical protein